MESQEFGPWVQNSSFNTRTVDLVTNSSKMTNVQHGHMDRGMTHFLGLMQHSERFHPTIQNGVLLNTYESFISGIFQLIFLNL
jgi:hypothetical protein